MYQLWVKYREDIVSVCNILSTIIAITTFFGFSVKDKSKQPLWESMPIVECQVEADKESDQEVMIIVIYLLTESEMYGLRLLLLHKSYK